MVTLYERDAVDARVALAFVAYIFKSDPEGEKSSVLLEWRNSIAEAHSAAIAESQPANLAAARLTSIADAIKDQLPRELRELPKSLNDRLSPTTGKAVR